MHLYHTHAESMRQYFESCRWIWWDECSEGQSTVIRNRKSQHKATRKRVSLHLVCKLYFHMIISCRIVCICIIMWLVGICTQVIGLSFMLKCTDTYMHNSRVVIHWVLWWLSVSNLFIWPLLVWLFDLCLFIYLIFISD